HVVPVALPPNAPLGTKSSQNATAASPATAARHSIRLVEEPPRNATGANPSRSDVSRRHNKALPPSHSPTVVAINSSSILAKREKPIQPTINSGMMTASTFGKWRSGGESLAQMGSALPPMQCKKSCLLLQPEERVAPARR